MFKLIAQLCDLVELGPVVVATIVVNQVIWLYVKMDLAMGYLLMVSSAHAQAPLDQVKWRA